MKTETTVSENRYSPWVCKQNAAGEWVVDQCDRVTGRIRRYNFPDEREAREFHSTVTKPYEK